MSNREIKFRGKVLYNGNHYFSGEWVYGYYLENEQGEGFIIDTTPDEFGNSRFAKVQVDPETVGQYTGLKDSTRTEEFPEGKEIYVGDIVRFEIDHGAEGIDSSEVVEAEVIYASCGYEPFMEYSYTYLDVEVVGNIHEDPTK